jgi:hypothetical protein
MERPSTQSPFAQCWYYLHWGDVYRLLGGRYPSFIAARLQLFLYVQASEFVSLLDRSYRYKFPCRAAETFTSEQNVHRCLCTHRICYPPDYRQLAERGLSPRKIHSIVDCSSQKWGQVQRVTCVSWPETGL